MPALQRVVPIGGATGLLCGLVAIVLAPHRVVAGGGVLLLATGLAGMGIGAYLGGMVGLNVENTRHKAFHDAIERGELLVIADVPRGRVEEIAARIKQAHPVAEPEGTDPRVFP